MDNMHNYYILGRDYNKFSLILSVPKPVSKSSPCLKEESAVSLAMTRAVLFCSHVTVTISLFPSVLDFPGLKDIVNQSIVFVAFPCFLSSL